jgi:hypothetical protein
MASDSTVVCACHGMLTIHRRYGQVTVPQNIAIIMSRILHRAEELSGQTKRADVDCSELQRLFETMALRLRQRYRLGMSTVQDHLKVCYQPLPQRYALKWVAEEV